MSFKEMCLCGPSVPCIDYFDVKGVNFSAWLHPLSSGQIDFLWQPNDPISRNASSIIVLQAPAGEEVVQDYTFKVHVAKGYVAKEEFPRSEITDGLEMHTYPICSTHGDQ